MNCEGLNVTRTHAAALLFMIVLYSYITTLHVTHETAVNDQKALLWCLSCEMYESYCKPILR